MNRHFLHKHSGNKVYISGEWKTTRKKQQQPVNQGNQSKKYIFNLKNIEQK